MTARVPDAGQGIVFRKDREGGAGLAAVELGAECSFETADAPLHAEAALLELVRQSLARAKLLEQELGVRVDVAAGRQ